MPKHKTMMSKPMSSMMSETSVGMAMAATRKAKPKTKTNQGKKPSLTGRELAMTRGKGKKKGLRKQGY